MIPPLLAGFAIKHGFKVIVAGAIVFTVLSTGKYIYNKGWNARDEIAKQEAIQTALELSELKSIALERGTEQVAKVYSTRADNQIQYKEVIKYVPKYTTGRPCLSADAVRLLNSETPDTIERVPNHTETVVEKSTGNAASDTDIATWAAEARREYEDCASNLNAIVDLSNHQGE